MSSGSGPTQLRMAVARDELMALYGIAVEEYRFVVKTGWDRAQHFLLLNVGLLTAGLGLIRAAPPPIPRILALLFLVGAGTCVIGILAILKNHEYYREAILKKTLVEDLLGFWHPIGGYHPTVAALAIATTTGQQRGSDILKDPDAWRRRGLRGGTLVFYVSVFLACIAVGDIIAALYVALG